MTRPPHPTAAHVADTLIARGHHGLIVTHDSPVHTAEDAAVAVGTDIGAIVKSLVFLLDDEPVLLLVSGAHRVDLERTGARLGGTLAPAPADVVRAVTGQELGGVAPVGHPADMSTYVDRTFEAYDKVWASGGTPDTLFHTTYRQLLRITAGIDFEVD